MRCNSGKRNQKNIGFISTRLAGCDGVSLEAAKWARILEDNGHQCFYMAGELQKMGQNLLLVKEAYFKHPVTENHPSPERSTR